MYSRHLKETSLLGETPLRNFVRYRNQPDKHGRGQGKGEREREGERWRGRGREREGEREGKRDREGEGGENWAPHPKGIPQYNKLGSVRHVCELQGVMTS